MKIPLKSQPKWLIILKITIASLLAFGLFALIYLIPATPTYEMLPDDYENPNETVLIAGGTD